MSKKFQYHDKYRAKPPQGPESGQYNVAEAIDKLRHRTPAVKIREPLNLYVKPPSVRPEVNDAYIKPFGADVRGGPIIKPVETYIWNGSIDQVLSRKPKTPLLDKSSKASNSKRASISSSKMLTPVKKQSTPQKQS